MKKPNACPICSELVLQNIKFTINAQISSDAIYAIMGSNNKEIIIINGTNKTLTLMTIGTTSTTSSTSLKTETAIQPFGICSLSLDDFYSQISNITDLWNNTIYIHCFENAGNTSFIKKLLDFDGAINDGKDLDRGFNSGSQPLIMTGKTTNTIGDTITKYVGNCIDIYKGDIIYGTETITGVIGIFFSIVHDSGKSIFIGSTMDRKLLIGYRLQWYGNKIYPLKSYTTGAQIS